MSSTGRKISNRYVALNIAGEIVGRFRLPGMWSSGATIARIVRIDVLRKERPR